MRAGLLRHRISIMRPTKTIDAYGQAIETWASVATVWARVKYVVVPEDDQAEGMHTVEKVEIEVRQPLTVYTGDRIEHDGVTYNITSITDPDEGAFQRYSILAQRQE